jgi:hypothetical protein
MENQKETLSVKAKPETKELIKQLLEQSEANSQGELLEIVLRQYALDSQRKGNALMCNDVDELQKLFKRQTDIYNNIINRANTTIADTVNNVTNDIDNLKNHITALASEIEAHKKTIIEQEKEIEEYIKTIATIKKTNDDLTLTIAEYNVAQNLQQIVADLQLKISNLEK